MYLIGFFAFNVLPSESRIGEGRSAGFATLKSERGLTTNTFLMPTVALSDVCSKAV